MEWVQIISAVGFPIFACCAMGWFIKYSGDRHKEEMDQIKEALNNNTLALTELVAYIKNDEKGSKK